MVKLIPHLFKTYGMIVYAQNHYKRKYVQDPMKRIGTEGGAKEVRMHPYFHGTDWSAFEQVPGSLHLGCD